jgi:hypothetical protein
MKFKYIYELGARVSRYKSLLREEVEKKILIYRTYCQETVDVNIVEFVNGEPIVYNSLT